MFVSKITIKYILSGTVIASLGEDVKADGVNEPLLTCVVRV